MPPKRVQNSAPQYATLLEIVHANPRLFTAYYLGGDTELFVYNCFQTANIAERLEPSPELARSYANIVLIAGLIPLHRVARAYARRALEMVTNLGNSSELAWVLEASALYNLGVGEWAIVEDALDRGAAISEHLGNHRLWGEFVTLRGQLLYFQGKFLAGRQSFAEVYNAAVHRHNTLQQAWGMNGQGEGLIHLGKPEESIPLLKAALDLYEKNADTISLFVCYGRLALAYLAQKNYLFAREAAAQGERLLPGSAPTSFSTIDGYTGLAKAYLTLWENDPQNQALKDSAQRACKAFHRYARIFPIGRPSAYLLQGLYDHLDGRVKQAHEHWQKSLAEAQRLRMPYETGHAYYEIGRHLNSADAQRENYLRQAIETFELLGALPALEDTRQALAKA